MKKIIIVLFISIFLLGAISAHGAIKQVYTRVFEPDGTTVPEPGTITFEAYMQLRPTEILTETSLGCDYNETLEGYIVVQAGNFETQPWAAGEVYEIKIWWNGMGPQVPLTTLIFDWGSSQVTDDAITLPVELLNPLSATYMENGSTLLEWTTASETDVQGFNVYRADEDVFENSAQLNASIIPGQGTTTEPEDYEFEDLDQLEFNTTYYYWLESVDFSGTSEVFDAVEYTPAEDPGSSDEEFDTNKLTVSNNPIVGNNVTIIYAIAGKQVNTPVEISIYSTKGQLVDNVTATGGEASISTSGFSSGVYFYQIKTESFNQIKKMVIVK